jgi:hypothetical protein
MSWGALPGARAHAHARRVRTAVHWRWVEWGRRGPDPCHRGRATPRVGRETAEGGPGRRRVEGLGPPVGC